MTKTQKALAALRRHVKDSLSLYIGMVTLREKRREWIDSLKPKARRRFEKYCPGVSQA